MFPIRALVLHVYKLQVAVVQSLELLCLTTHTFCLLSSLSNQPGEYSIETFLSATSTLESMTRVRLWAPVDAVFVRLQRLHDLLPVCARLNLVAATVRDDCALRVVSAGLLDKELG